MKGFKGTAVFAAIVFGLVAFAYFGVHKKNEKENERKEKDAVVLKLPPDQIQNVEIRNKAGETIALEKKDGKWRLTQPLQESAESVTVEGVLNGLSGEKSQETVAEGDGVNWATFGLDKPVAKVIVKSADGKTQEIQQGGESFDGNFYIRSDQDKKVLLVASSWDANANKSLKDFRNRSVMHGEGGDFDRIQVSDKLKKGKSSAFTLVRKDGKWALEGRPDAKIGDEAVRSFVDQLKNLRIMEFPSEKKNDPKELAKYGLTSPAFTAKLSKGDGKAEGTSWELKISAPKGDAKPDDAGYVNAVSTDAPAIVQVYRSAAENLSRSPEDFFDKKAPFQFTAGDVNEIHIKTEKLTLEARKQNGAWALARPVENKELDAAKLDDLVGKLGRFEVGQFLGKEKGKGLSPAKNGITVLNAKSEPLLQVSWGETYTVPGADGQPPQKYHYVRTDKSDQTFGVLDTHVNMLPLAEILKDKAKAEVPKDGGQAPVSTSAAPTPEKDSKKN